MDSEKRIAEIHAAIADNLKLDGPVLTINPTDDKDIFQTVLAYDGVTVRGRYNYALHELNPTELAAQAAIELINGWSSARLWRQRF